MAKTKTNRPAAGRRRPAAQQAAGKTLNPRAIFLGLGAAAVVIGLIAIVLSGVGNEAAGAAELDATVAVRGSPLPSAASEPGAADPAVGLTIPEVDGEDFDGSPVSISLNGKPKLIIVVAHWCPFCQEEVPAIQSWIEANGLPDDVELVSVSTNISQFRENFPSVEWLKREDWTVPVIVDDQDYSVYRAFGSPAFPSFVLVGSDGTVVGRPSGAGQFEFFDTYVELLRAS